MVGDEDSVMKKIVLMLALASAATGAIAQTELATRQAQLAALETNFSDGIMRVTRDGHLVKCDATGQAHEITYGAMVTDDPLWKDGKPVKCRRDMFAN